MVVYSQIMTKFLYYCQQYKLSLIIFVGVCFIFSFLHLQNFDPSHPTLVNNTCIQGVRLCSSIKEVIDACIAAFSSLARLFITTAPVVAFYFVLRLYLSDVLYIPILTSPIRSGLRRGIVHSKDH